MKKIIMLINYCCEMIGEGKFEDRDFSIKKIDNSFRIDGLKCEPTKGKLLKFHASLIDGIFEIIFIDGINSETHVFKGSVLGNSIKGVYYADEKKVNVINAIFGECGEIESLKRNDKQYELDIS